MTRTTTGGPDRRCSIHRIDAISAVALGGTVVLLAASWWRYEAAARRGARRRASEATERRVATRLGAVRGSASLGMPSLPEPPLRLAPSIRADASPPDPRARLWRDASLAMVGIAGLALAGSLGLLPNLVGARRPAAGDRPASGSPVVLSAPGGLAAPTLPLTGGPGPGPTSTPTPTARPTPTASPDP